MRTDAKGHSVATKKQTIRLIDPDTFQPWESRDGYIGVAEMRTDGTLDVDDIDPERVDLSLRSVKIPDGDLTGLSRLQNLQRLGVGGRSATVLDVTGLTSLRTLAIGHIRGLERIIGLDTLVNLEELMITSQHQITDLPSLRVLTNLKSVELALMRSLTSLAPIAEAPNLRYLKIDNVHARDEDAQLLRDHPRLLGFSNWAGSGYDPEAFVDVVGRPEVPYRWREEYPGDDAMPEVRSLPTDVPEHMLEFTVHVSAGTGYGSYWPVYQVGPSIMDRRADWGSTFDRLLIELVTTAHGSKEFAEPVRIHNGWRGTLPEVRANRRERQLRVSVASSLDADTLRERNASRSPALFAQALGEVRAALPHLRSVLREDDDFDLDGLITASAVLLADRPRTADTLTEMFDRIEREDRDRRAAFRDAQG